MWEASIFRYPTTQEFSLPGDLASCCNVSGAQAGKICRLYESLAKLHASHESSNASHSDNRKAAVIDRAEAMAHTEGIPSQVVANLYEELVEASIAYELERFDGR